MIFTQATPQSPCQVKIRDGSVDKDRLILSNLSREVLGSLPQAVLYGGLGNRLEVEINGAKKEIAIEPVEVIVIGIDGLRQDVLYDSTEASYLDSIGCGGSPCYVDRATLPGLSQIMTEAGTIKLKDVTAIFPSITLASWASIFTGKLPNETGILGNEFFARDLALQIPSRYNSPPGMISFSSGAFPGYDAFGHIDRFQDDFFVPYQSDWSEPVDPNRGPQNLLLSPSAKTIYQILGEIPGLRERIASKGGDVSVVANNHYARGAYWLTWDAEFPWGAGEVMDQVSWDKLDDYLGGKYLDGILFPRRNEVPFSALTTWYLPGLDHEAHEDGMGAYRDYFVRVTDRHILSVVNRLKGLDEFDNKIFLITADHGATGMPENLTYKDRNFLGFEVERDAEISCELKLNFVDPGSAAEITSLQKAERANNNLHIWELGKIFQLAGQFTRGSFSYRVLAPEPIANLFPKKETYGARSTVPESNIKAAFNGPMAHIYIDNSGDMARVAELFRLTMQSEYTLEAIRWLNLTEDGYLDLRDSIGRLNSSIDQVLVRQADASGQSYYCVFDGLNDDGSIRCATNNPFSSEEYVNAWERVNGMNHPQRSGDILLLMKGERGDINQRFTTGVSCKSWHGSLSRTDSYVPFIVAYPGGNKDEVQKILEQDSVCKADFSQCKGNWKLPDIVKEIISRQYE